MAGKTKQEGINSQLAIVMKSGKTSLGYKSVLTAVRNGKSKALILSNNLPILRKSQLEYYAVLANVKTISYGGNNSELGTACGKLFRVSCISINDAGDSDILAEDKN
jgi:large subunit ribosomal protein L30e